MKRRFLNSFSGILLSTVILLTGCGVTEENHTVLVNSGESTLSYSLVSASYEDVILTLNLDATSIQTKDQEVSFGVTGKYVNKVYVRKGDTVKKGDLLCELSSDALEEEIERLTYQVKRNELQLSYLDSNEALDIQDQWVSQMATGYPSADTVKENIKMLQENYDRQRVLINDSLEFDREELAKKQKELKDSRLYATMDGVIYKIKDFLEGSTTKAGEVVMTVIDNTDVLFKVPNTEYKDIFSEGQHIDMKVNYSTAAGEYIVTPYEKDSWTDCMLFSVYTGPDNVTVDVGTYGTISVEVERKEHVLTIPKMALRNAGDDYYVYMLTEDNVREIRYVKVGLIGDDRVEILDGLTEGEKVVRK